MKLWEIKAEALKLMFSATDMNFSYDEFQNGTVYNNPNTKLKLIGMEDSIRRGIDLYYSMVGEQTQVEKYDVDPESDDDRNKIKLNDDVGFPTRVDFVAYIGDRLVLKKQQINYFYDSIKKEIIFTDKDYQAIYVDQLGLTLKFIVWYKTKKKNLPYTGLNELAYDLNVLNIPEEVQRMLPYYIKAEAYEEDEPSKAQEARQYYMHFLQSIRKPFSKVQTRVKKSKIFNRM